MNSNIVNRHEILVNLALFESIRQEQPNIFYLDHFVLLMLSLLSKKNQVSNTEIQKLFQENLSMKIPLVSVNKIAKKAVEKGYFQLNKNNHKNSQLHKIYTLKIEKIQKQNKKFNTLKDKIKTSQENFYRRFKKFIKNKYKLDIDLVKCKKLFYIHFLKNYKDIQNVEYPISQNIYNENYVVNDFIRYLYENQNNELLKCLEQIIRGNWVSNYLFMWKNDAHKGNLKGVKVFFDTPLIISLLGFNGEFSKKITKELLDLLHKLGAKTYIFSHNIEETKILLKGWAEAVKQQNFKYMRLSTIEEIRDKDYNYQDLENLSIRIKNNLYSLKIEETKVRIKDEYRISEQKLEDSISHEESNYTGKKVHIDIESAASIFSLRLGCPTLNITDRPYIFVSSTFKVVNNINNFFNDDYNEDNPKNIPIFVMDKWLTNLCWLLSPKQSTLPRDFLVAHSYASLNTSDKVWEDFNKFLEKYEKQPEITSEGLDAIRYEKDFKSCVEEYAVLKGTIKQKNIPDIIKEGRKKIYKNYELKNNKLKSENKIFKERSKKLSNIMAHTITVSISIIILVIVLFFIYYLKDTKYWFWVAILVTITTSGFGIKYPYKKIQNFIYKKISNYLWKSI